MRPIFNRLIDPMTSVDWLLLWCGCIMVFVIVLYISSYDELTIWCDKDILDKAFIPKYHTSKISELNRSSTSPVDVVHMMDLQHVLTDFSDPIAK